MRHDPELTLGMMNNGHGVPGGRADGPASTQEVDLVVRVDPPTQIKRQMEIQEAGVGTGAQHVALLGLSLGAGLVRGQAGGAADGSILAGQFAGEEFLSPGIVGDFLVGQEGQEPLLEGAEAAFDFAFGLRAGRDQMGDPQRREGPLELGTGIPAVGRGLMAEEGQAIGVEGQRPALDGEGVAKVLEVVPSRIGGDEDTPHQLAGVIIHRQEERLFVQGGPPLVDGGIVLPEFAHWRTLPPAPGLGGRRRRADQQWEVSAGVGGDGFAVALEGEAGRQFIGDELVIGRSLERQEVGEELLHVGGPGDAMVASGEVETEGVRVLKPGGAQAEEMGAADLQKLRGGVGVEVALVEGVQDLLEERQSDALKELVFCKGPLDGGGARRARPFVGLRYAPASSKPGPAGKASCPAGQENSAVSFCSLSSLLLFPPRQ